MSEINKKNLEHLAELARIEIDGRSEEKLIKDLSKILDYFAELKELNTGGTEQPLQVSDNKSLRNDSDDEAKNNGVAEKITKAFPDEKDGFLKVPPVFE